MSEDNGGAKVGFFLAGLGIGAVLALLFAPRSGEETRKFIVHKAEEGRDFVVTRTDEIRKQAEDRWRKARTWSANRRNCFRPRWKQASKRTRKKKPKRSKSPEAAKPHVSEPWSKILG